MNDQYTELYSSYQWFVPSQFNIAQACAHRWAESPVEGRRIAIFHENDWGRREVWTYTRLSETSNQLANGLVKMGVRPGDRVALVMGQRPEIVAAYMAIFSVGAVAMPLSPMLGADGLAARFQDSEARVAIIDPAASPEVLTAQAQCPALTRIIGLELQHEAVIPWRTLLARQSTEFRLVTTRSSSPALLLYTSGTTGAPKGALLAHGALVGILPGFVASQNWFPRKGDVFWSPVDWSWAAGLMNALLPTLYFGRAIVGTLGRYSPTRAFEVMERYQVTNAFLYPSTLNLMMDEIPTPRAQFRLSLRAVMTTGEDLGQEGFQWCQQALGITPNEMFGQTEMNYIVGNSSKRWPARPGSIGRPYPGHLVSVLDAQGRACPADTVGEIALHRNDIHGHPDPALFLGYWNNPEATESKFTGDWCLTGDLGYVDKDGYYWYAGRSDDAFKSSGHQIGPGVIEDCLMRHAAVAKAAVVPKPDPVRGSLIKAYVVLKQAARTDDAGKLQAQLQDHVRHRLTPYQTPREIEFVESLPLTATGKIRRHVLRAREQQHVKARIDTTD